MSSIDKRALREAAERATESDWIVDAHEGWHAVIPVADAVNGNYIIAEFQGPESKRNRDFVAAANPATVLALLDELEAKDQRISHPEQWTRDIEESLIAATDRNTELEKRIAELEARTLTVKLPNRKCADDYVDDIFRNDDLAAINNACRLECKVKLKDACAAAGIALDTGE